MTKIFDFRQLNSRKRELNLLRKLNYPADSASPDGQVKVNSEKLRSGRYIAKCKAVFPDRLFYMKVAVYL